jgi:hypothetical protein
VFIFSVVEQEGAAVNALLISCGPMIKKRGNAALPYLNSHLPKAP